MASRSPAAAATERRGGRRTASVVSGRRGLVAVLPFLVAFGASMATSGMAAALGTAGEPLQQRYTGRVCASCPSFVVELDEEAAAREGVSVGTRVVPNPAEAEHRYHLSPEAMILMEMMEAGAEADPTPITKDEPPKASAAAGGGPAIAPALACTCDFIPLSSETVPAPVRKELPVDAKGDAAGESSKKEENKDNAAGKKEKPADAAATKGKGFREQREEEDDRAEMAPPASHTERLMAYDPEERQERDDDRAEERAEDKLVHAFGG